MKARNKLILILSATAVLMLGAWAWSAYHTTKPAVPMPGGNPAALSDMSAATDTAPAADNVSSMYQQQVQQLEQHLNHAPDDTTHLIRLAVLYQDGHQQEKAIPLYQHYLKLHPRNRQAWLDLSNCYAQASNWNNALEATQGLLDHYPDDPFALYNLGAIHANLGQTDAARAIWNKLTAPGVPAHVAAMAKESLSRLNPTTSK